MTFINGIPKLPNVAPFFFRPPQKVSLESARLIRSENRETKAVVLKLPEVVDYNINDTITLSVYNL